MTVFERFKKVKAFAFDVDGVFTTGDILVSENGDQLRTFNVKDGYALQLAVKSGYPVLIVSGGKSKGVKLRLEALGVEDVFINESHKEAVLVKWVKKNQLDLNDILFMGDDVPDIAVMKVVGFPVCPADAIEDIKSICHYISPKSGGKGAVRDVIEKVMRLQGTWDSNPSVKSI
jgi:3-deoxy-D-manno-octulosonate 8-phosphate phosphatase (KDO 8-P phosphatase)